MISTETYVLQPVLNDLPFPLVIIIIVITIIFTLRDYLTIDIPVDKRTRNPVFSFVVLLLLLVNEVNSPYLYPSLF